MKRLVDALEDVVRAEIGSDESFAGLEDRALEVSNEAVRRVLSDALHRIEEELGDGDVLIKGERYTPHGRGKGKYPSLVGWLVVPRTNYRKVGVRNGPTAIALDLAAGLVEGMTPALAERVAMGNGEAESRALHQQMLSSRRVPPSRAVLAKLYVAPSSSTTIFRPRCPARRRRYSADIQVAKSSKPHPDPTQLAPIGLTSSSLHDWCGRERWVAGTTST